MSRSTARVIDPLAFPRLLVVIHTVQHRISIGSKCAPTPGTSQVGGDEKIFTQITRQSAELFVFHRGCSAVADQHDGAPSGLLFFLHTHETKNSNTAPSKTLPHRPIPHHTPQGASFPPGEGVGPCHHFTAQTCKRGSRTLALILNKFSSLYVFPHVVGPSPWSLLGVALLSVVLDLPPLLLWPSFLDVATQRHPLKAVGPH